MTLSLEDIAHGVEDAQKQQEQYEEWVRKAIESKDLDIYCKKFIDHGSLWVMLVWTCRRDLTDCVSLFLSFRSPV